MTNTTEWQPPGTGPQPPPRKRHILRWVLIGTGAVLALIIGLGAAFGGTTPQPQVQQGQTSLAAPSAPAAPTTPPAPTFTTEQEQAIQSAQGYLDDGGGFSKAGLIEQLSSPYGEDFSPSLARFAVRHVDVNWNHQAVISAQGYLDSGGGFSYAGLVEQLESPYGEQFTPAQAQHGATVALRS